ncbi:uncharacterized protein LOC141630162 [Silene latifolia]|uniref:uncharacterized protein LOC141630162 n=1 Tax=Silene latifolia TaxID=37657 RepID=UPI003D7867EE
MGDDNPFFQYMCESYTNENYDGKQFENDWNAEQQYRCYNEYDSYDQGEGSGYGYDDNNTGNTEKRSVFGFDYNNMENKENAEEANGDGIDYNDKFVFDYTFHTFEEAFDHINDVAYGLGFHLIKYKYHMKKSPPYKIIACERSKPYKSNAKDPEKPQRKSKTKRLKCPFGVRKEFIKQQRQSHVKPGMVRHAFTLRFPDQPAPIFKQIYNENARLSAKDMDMRNSVQYMLHLANEFNYLSEYMVEGEEKALTHVWFAHPEGVEMLKAWPDVILIDSTYKTNKYDLILVQCVGVTPVRKSILIGYALIKRESSDGYIWVLRRLKSLLGPDVKPTVFVTDHDQRDLISALPEVFRTSYNFLCLFHVYNAVKAKATILEKNGNFGKAVAHDAWKKVIKAKTFDECKLEWNELKKKYCSHPALISYLELTWWHKIHMFGKCFTNLVLHFGNTTTSRVESAYAQLKMWLGSAELTLDSLWKRADVMMHEQHIEIRKTLENSISKRVVSNLYYGNIFSMLGGRVSATAIEAMQVEYNRGTDLAVVEGRKTHPSDIHGFWSRLAYTESSHRRSSPNDVMEELLNKVRKSHVSVQRDVIETLFSKLYPEDEVVEELEKAETCPGHPRKSNTRNKSGVEHARRSHPSTTTTTDGGDEAPLTLNFDPISHIGGFVYEEFVPIPVKDCFLGAFDLDGDGHCGFRILSHAKTGNARNYIEMRNLLLGELKDNVYAKVYYGQRNNACRRIKWAKHKGCLKKNWMEGLDLFGFATLFNLTICCVTMSYTLDGTDIWAGSSTYLPLRAAPGVRAPYGILWILFTGNYFVRLRVNDNSAMPPIHSRWSSLRDDDIAHYVDIYTERLTLWISYVYSGLLHNPFGNGNESEVIYM